MVAFGEFELDEARFELRRAGRPVHVEPRVLEVLLYLSRHADRVVTKDELLEAVWRGRFVSETVLNRSIAEARKALGGGDPRSSCIRTIHGRGYRFALPEGPPTQAKVRPVAFENPTPLESAAPLASAAPPENATPWPAAATETPAVPSPPAGRLLLRLGGTLALLAAAVLLWRGWSERSREGQEAPAAPLVLALVPISAPAGETELELAALSLGDLLSQRLSSLPGVTLRPSDAAAKARLAASSPAELAQRVGVGLVLSGSIERSAQSGNGRVELTLFDLRAEAPDRRWVPWEYDLPLLAQAGDLERIQRATEAIARRVADELRIDLDPDRTAQSTPRDLRAYRLYLRAFGRQAEVSCLGTGAAQLLRESLALDPGYPPAWQAYASAEYNQAWACGEASDHYEKALEALARSEALAPTRLAATLRAVILAETNRVEEGYAVLRDAESRWPGDAGLDFQGAQLLHYAGFLDEAQRRFERSHSVDPLFSAEGWIPRTPYYRGDYARFLEVLPAIESPIFRYYRASAELARGRDAEARRLLEPVFRMSPSDLFARLSQALLAILEGHEREGGVILDHLALQRAELGGSDGEVTYKIAQLYGRAGDGDKALQQLGLTVDQGFFCTPCLRAEPLFDAFRGREEFRRLLAAAEQRHAEFGARFDLQE